MTYTEKRGCIALLTGLFQGKRGESNESATYEYRLRDDFLSPAEMRFLEALRTAVGERATICPKVNLKDIFFDPNARGRSAATNKISQRHVDFLLCDPVTMRPLVGIELDDSSHQRDSRRQRDTEVNAAFQSAGLSLLRQPTQHHYDILRLTHLLESVLPPTIRNPPNSTGSTSSQLPVPFDPSMFEALPICPKCGIPMVERTVNKGQYKGRKFYGCRNFPQCREMKPFGG